MKIGYAIGKIFLRATTFLFNVVCRVMSFQSCRTHNVAKSKNFWDSSQEFYDFFHFDVEFRNNYRYNIGEEMATPFKFVLYMWVYVNPRWVHDSIWYPMHKSRSSFGLWTFMCLWVQLEKFVLIASQSSHMPF